eukprot:1158630-Pelagomonas_calceolata.AAC.6
MPNGVMLPSERPCILLLASSLYKPVCNKIKKGPVLTVLALGTLGDTESDLVLTFHCSNTYISTSQGCSVRRTLHIIGFKLYTHFITFQGCRSSNFTSQLTKSSQQIFIEAQSFKDEKRLKGRLEAASRLAGGSPSGPSYLRPFVRSKNSKDLDFTLYRIVSLKPSN